MSFPPTENNDEKIENEDKLKSPVEMEAAELKERDSELQVRQFGALESQRGSTAKSKGDAADKQSEKDESEIKFESVACGFAHTILVTKKGDVVACGCHKHGQLGVGKLNLNTVVLMCDKCALLSAEFECDECPKQIDKEKNGRKERNPRFCKTCWMLYHKSKKDAFHKRISLKAPDKRKFSSELRPVRAILQELELRRPQTAEEEAALLQQPDAGAAGDNEPAAKQLVDLRGGLSVACGDSHTMVIAAPPQLFGGQSSGAVFGWGCGWSGRLGRAGGGDDVARLLALPQPPMRVGGRETQRSGAQTTRRSGSASARLITATQVAAGGRHSLILVDGCVLSAGSNQYGQLGRDTHPWGGGGGGAFDESAEWHPVMLPAAGPGRALEVKQVACGDQHCLLLACCGDSAARVYAWGAAADGRLGLGSEEHDRRRPALVPGVGEKPQHGAVEMVACGAAHSAAVTDRGVLWTWGRNEAGQCGPFKHNDWKKVLDKVDKETRERLGKAAAEEEKFKLDMRIKEKALDKLGGPVPILDPFCMQWQVNDEPATLERYLQHEKANERKNLAADAANAAAADTSKTPRSSELLATRRKEGSSAPAASRGVGRSGGSDAGVSRAPSPRAARGTRGSGTRASNKSDEHASSHGESVPPAHPQVSCGSSHTLVLFNGSLWLLGSGLDLEPRQRNFELVMEENKDDVPKLAVPFRPRLVKNAFKDTAEVCASDPGGGRAALEPKPKKGGDEKGEVKEFDKVRYTLVQQEIVLEEDEGEGGTKFKDRHCLTFTFSGDFDLKPQKHKDQQLDHEPLQIAFTGPRCPPSVRLLSVEDGPWFNVLGGKIRGQEKNDVWVTSRYGPGWRPGPLWRIELKGEPTKISALEVGEDYWIEGIDKDDDILFTLERWGLDLLPGRSDPAWFLYGPGHSFSTRPHSRSGGGGVGQTAGSSVQSGTDRARAPVNSQKSGDVVSSSGAGEGSEEGLERPSATLGGTGTVSSDNHSTGGTAKVEEDVVKELFEKQATIKLKPQKDKVRKIFGPDKGSGIAEEVGVMLSFKGSEAAAEDGEPVGTGWAVCRAGVNRKKAKDNLAPCFTVEMVDQVLTPELQKFEDLADWITTNAKCNNSENMLACLKGSVPPLKQIASGAYHACLLTQDGDLLVWGDGSLGRLALGNEQSQLVPVVLELEAAGVPGLEFKAGRPKEALPGEEIQRVLVQAAPPSAPDPAGNMEQLQLDDWVVEVDGEDLERSEDKEAAEKLLKGFPNSFVAVHCRRTPNVSSDQPEPAASGEGESGENDQQRPPFKDVTAYFIRTAGGA